MRETQTFIVVDCIVMHRTGVCILFPYFVRNSFDFDIPDKGNGSMDFTDKVERTLCKMRQC